MSIHIIKGPNIQKKGLIPLMKAIWDNPNLSFQAKGLIAYCMTMSGIEELDVVKLSKSIGIGRGSTYGAIYECIEHGYAYRAQHRKDTGGFGGFHTYISCSREDIKYVKKHYAQLDGCPEEYEDKITTFNEI
jgi:reverse gyrase